jgi:hypothetical protein
MIHYNIQTAGTLRENRALREIISNTEMEAYKQQAINGKFDHELVFGHRRRLDEEPSQSQPLQDEQSQDRQLQAISAPWKVNGLVVSHFFECLSLYFIFYTGLSCVFI